MGRTSPKNLTHTEHAGTGGLLTKILVTGGAGYIGSHTLIELVAAGYEPIVVDSLANSNIESLKRVETIIGKPIPFHHFDLRERDKLAKLFAEEAFEAVIHFAGLKAVGESVNQPLKYYENNLTSTLLLLDVMQQYGVRQLIFSSSATVYGTPEKLPLTEDSTVGMGITNPYGWTKYMIEQIIAGVCAADTSFAATILRYFNPVGAHESGLIGEDPRGTPNNLLPYVAQVAVGKRPHIMVFGDNYNTPDGTGVRDYIHVVDLARGPVAAGGLDGVAGAGAVDQDALLSDGRAALGEAGIDRVFLGHIDQAEHAAQFLGQGFAGGLVQIKQGHLHAVGGQAACRRRTQA